MMRLQLDNLNLILSRIDRFLMMGDKLATLIEDCSDKICLEPESLTMHFREIYNLWEMLVDDMKYTHIEGIEECCEKINLLKSALSAAFYEYEISGTSGNPANISYLYQWQSRYSWYYETIRDKMYDVRQTVECSCSMASMSMVYASPEMMSAIIFEENKTEQYPFLHADIIDENLMQEDCMMVEVYGSPEMMFEIFEENGLNEKVFENNTSDKQGTFCIYCGKKYSDQSGICASCGKKNIMVEDLEATVKFCRNCGMAVPMIAKYCTWCGNLADTTANTKESPKTNIFSKLFKGNK